MIKKPQLSKERQRISELLQKIEKLAFRCVHADPLIRGTPGEVFRVCGKQGCKCARDRKNRHGPYRVIQIRKDGKQKQIALRQDQRDLWEQAKSYQNQIKYLSDLKNYYGELEQHIRKVIMNRIKEWPT